MRLHTSRAGLATVAILASSTALPVVSAGFFSTPMLVVRGAVADFLGTGERFQRLNKRQNAPGVDTATFQTPSPAPQPSLHAPGTETDVIGNAQSLGVQVNSGERGTPPATTDEGIGFANPLTEANPTGTLHGQTGGVYDDSNIGTVQASLQNAISTGNAVANAVSNSVATGEVLGGGQATHAASEAQGLSGPSSVEIGLTTIGGKIFPVEGTSIITASSAFQLQAPNGASLCSGGAIFGTMTLCPSAAGGQKTLNGPRFGDLTVSIGIGLASFTVIFSTLFYLQ